MENVDMFNNATAQLTFHDFLDRMRHPSAADLVRSIKNFIGAFLSNPPEPERDSQSVQDFLTTTEDAFKAHPLWAGATEEEFESSGEGLEKYLMTKLFARAFAPLPEDAEQDQRLSEKMSILQAFIRPEHLDISESFQNETSWLLAQKELQKINTYKAPRDKLVCILNCCRVINNLLLNVSMANQENPPGADDFLPVLIYVVIKANPPQLHSNLLYIQRYRHQSRLVSEASYFYTNLVSAESFIGNLDSTSLTIDPTEFDEKMEAGHRAVAAINAVASTVVENEKVTSAREKPSQKEKLAKPKDTSRGVSATENDHVSPAKGEKHINFRGPPATSAELGTEEGTDPKVLSIEKIEAEAFGQVLEADKTGQLAKDYPFLYASAGDLRVMDVESLLHEYKELVLRYVALRKSVESTAIAEKKPPASLHAEPRQELGAATQEDTLIAASRTVSLGQILTRPEDRAELFAEETSVHSEPGLETELQELDSSGLDTAGSLEQESAEKIVVEDPESTPEETKEVPQDTETKEVPQDTESKEVPQDTETKEVPQDTETKEVPQDTETKEVTQEMPSLSIDSTEESTPTESRMDHDDTQESTLKDDQETTNSKVGDKLTGSDKTSRRSNGSETKGSASPESVESFYGFPESGVFPEFEVVGLDEDSHTPELLDYCPDEADHEMYVTP